MVLIKFVEVQTKSKDGYKANAAGILTKVKEDAKKKHQAVIDSVGEAVDLTKVGWKVGDVVIFNDYDTLKFGDENNNWGLCKAESIWASYTEETEE